MTESTRNLLVGLFVLSALSVLGLLMMLFGEAPSWLGGSEWTLGITDVQELNGVAEGSPIYLSGVEIGRIQSLEFVNTDRPDQGVVIVAGIKNTYSVPKDAMAKVYGATLGLGAGHIEIVVPPGSTGELVDRKAAQIPGEMRNAIGEIISKEMLSSFEETLVHIGELAAAATPVAENLAKLLEEKPVAEVDKPGEREKGVRGNFATMTERLDDLVSNINTILGDEHVQDDVKTAVSDLRAATEGLKRTAQIWKSESQRLGKGLNEGVDETRGNLDVAFDKMNTVLEELETAGRSLTQLVQRVEAGEGTVGMLIRDDRLYEAAVLTFERLTEFIGTLQRIVGKAEQDGYIKVGKATPVGILTKDVPIGEFAAKVIDVFDTTGKDKQQVATRSLEKQ